MKTSIETIEFSCYLKKKLKTKVSMGNLDIKFINGHLIKFDKTKKNMRI
ncbi:MAG: hypothetical protein J6J17_05535 [Bacilli bacterium]|nr:hypothetical protein [Bacilli bacterium]